MKSGMRCRVGMKIHGLVLGLIGCTHMEAPPPIVAPAGLDVTMDPSEGGVIIEDEVRRHAAPAGMMRRRVYAVQERFVRWYPPTRRQTGHWWWPPTLPDYPEDWVALRGGPVPAPGQRFVVFDDEGPRGVVEPTGERCPPGHEDCVACEADDPERLHWARFVGAVPDRGNGSFQALGPFDIGESLPAARDLWQMDDRRVGRWELNPVVDLDGDTSWGVHSVNDAARSITPCGDTLVAGGWDRDEPVDAKPEPLILWFNADGTFSDRRPDALAWTQLNGIACDRENKIVGAGTRSTGDGDALAFTVLGSADQPTWYDKGVAGPDGAGAVACDPRGFCAVAGFRTANGKAYAVVRVHHP